MFKKFTKVLMIILLAISLSVALGSEAKSALFWIPGGIFCYNPVCFECLIKGMGNAIKAEAVLYFDIDKVNVKVFCNNNGDQNLTGIGVPHQLLLDISVVEPVVPEDLVKNGTAYLDICYEEDDFDEKVEAELKELDATDLICEKNNWYWSEDEGYELIGYRATVIFEMEDTERIKYVMDVYPDGEGCYDYDVIEETVIRK